LNTAPVNSRTPSTSWNTGRIDAALAEQRESLADGFQLAGDQ